MNDPRAPSGPADAAQPDPSDDAAALPADSPDDGPDPLHRMSMRLGRRVRSAGSGARTYLKLLE